MSGKTNRKHRRNKAWCERYAKTGRRETNKAIKLERHKKAHPRDTGQKTPANYTRKKPLDYFEKQLENKLKYFNKKP